jgi:hypothetical protein
MQLITHQTHLDQLPASDLSIFITRRVCQLSEETDIPPNLILVETNDDITGPDYAFVGNRGLLSDLYEERSLKEEGFARPYEWVVYLPELQLYETLYLINGEDGYWILIPEDIVEAHPDLKYVLTAPELGGLSEPQPL